MSKITFWKCYVCNRVKPRKEFGEISLKAICKDCQAQLSGFNENMPNAPRVCRVKAKRVFHTRREPKNDGAK